MKILVYGLNFSPELTGIGKYSGEMATWFSDNSNDVKVITAHRIILNGKFIKDSHLGSIRLLMINLILSDVLSLFQKNKYF